MTASTTANRRRATGALAGLLTALLVAGCDRALDPNQARLCRIALVAVRDGVGALDILRQAPLSPQASDPGVRIDYAETDGSVRRLSFVECSFADNGHGIPELASLRTSRGPVSDPSLFFLKRFWLSAVEADSADPQPVAVWIAAPSLSPPTAYALQALLSALPSIASYGLLATAYSLIYGLVGRINLAFGEFAAIGAGAAILGATAGQGPWAVLAAPLALMAAVWAAVWNGLGIARWVFTPLRHATRQQGLVATIGLALFLNEYLRLSQGSTPRWVSPVGGQPIGIARSSDYLVTLTPLTLDLALLSAALAVAILLLLARTQFGRNWRAMADDAGAAALLGVDPGRVFAQTFALASALAGLAGGLVVLVYGSFGTTLGTTLGLKALLAAVLGGIGSVPGAFLGGIALGVLEALWSAFFPIEYRDLVSFVVLVVALILRPGGILGYADVDPRRV